MSLSYRDYCSLVGHELGYGRGEHFGEPKWTVRQWNDIEHCVKRGYSEFLYPQPMGTNEVYEWSFLRPPIRLTWPEGVSEQELDFDVGGIDGPIVVNGGGVACVVTNEQEVMHRHAMSPNARGRPQVACLSQNNETMLGEGQRTLLRVWPVSDAQYELSFVAILLPGDLSDSRPYPVGGPAHAQTILAAMLAVAERDILNRAGVHAEAWPARLAASLSQDRKRKPQRQGLMGPLPSWEAGAVRVGWGVYPLIAINGVIPG